MTPQQKRRAAKIRARRALIKEIQSAGFVQCARCGAAADDLDEIVNRSQGGDPTSREGTQPLCRPCHDWKTTHPKEALESGWMKHGWVTK